MTLLKLHAKNNPRPDFDCRAYQPVAGSKRCQHYLEGGACALATEFMCVEWLKANGRRVPEAHPGRTASPRQAELLSFPGTDAREISAHSVPGAPTAPESEAPPTPVPAGPRAPITPEEIASFKALGVELCLDLEDVGPVWLVPHYTGQARKEITPEHAATLRLLLDAFPGARIGAFETNLNYHKDLRE